jgi:TRAP-type C4-dicarboxylate transport system substrate-binding protein
VLLISDRVLELLEEQDAAILLEEAEILNRRAGELLEETMQAQRAAIEDAGGHFEESTPEERTDTARNLRSGNASGIEKIRNRQRTLVDRIETENNG